MSTPSAQSNVLVAIATVALLVVGLDAQRGGGAGAAGGAVPQGGAAPQGGPAINNQTSTGNAINGKQLYLGYGCYACHGYNAQTGNGQRLLPPRLNQAQFVGYLRAP